MRLCNYRLMNAMVFLIKMLVECKFCALNNITCQKINKKYCNATKKNRFSTTKQFTPKQ